MKKEILELAQKLYFDLPFYERWNIRKFYKSNYWDVTEKWQNCVHQAERMREEGIMFLKHKVK